VTLLQVVIAEANFIHTTKWNKWPIKFSGPTGSDTYTNNGQKKVQVSTGRNSAAVQIALDFIPSPQ
jgi:hypothetical protein